MVVQCKERRGEVSWEGGGQLKVVLASGKWIGSDRSKCDKVL